MPAEMAVETFDLTVQVVALAFLVAIASRLYPRVIV